MPEERRKKTELLLYCAAIYVGWTALEFLLRPQIDRIPNAWITTLLWTVILKNAVFTVPALLMIKRWSSGVSVTLREMFLSAVDWRKYLPLFALFTVCILAMDYFAHGKLGVSGTFTYPDMISMLFAGLTEETAFRGWLLNAVIKGKTKKQIWLLIILNSVLFLLMHFPIWLYEGVFSENFTDFWFLGVLGLSILFSWAFIKSRNILLPVFLHLYWDLLTLLFV